MDYIKLTFDKLLIDDISDLVVHDSCGAVSIFVGTTRDNFEGKKVIRLEYEAYEPMALKAMKSICDEVRNRWPSVYGIAIYHRLGAVPCKEASVVIAVSSPHRRDSLDAVSHCIDSLKANVPIWKKEIYEDSEPVWKENVECRDIKKEPSFTRSTVDKNLIQINVSNEEIQKRIQNFIERKRAQVNLSNIHDFIPNIGESEKEDTETCARVRTQFVKRSDSKGHLKVCRVYNEWGPQTVHHEPQTDEPVDTKLPHSIAERVNVIESYLSTTPVSSDIYKRLKEMEDKIAFLESVSPEYSQFWKRNKHCNDIKQELAEYTITAEDIDRKIELLEMQQNHI
ncbi:unnamed protein product [Leptosia nina]|uniref:Molybdopterin synthase catalytic subunit n=1 Tax=Leptosia nina TaxID=320188 RepID=A0AAV1JFN0_9NEOP